MKRTKIVLVGGGSYSWAPTIVKDMLFTESLRDAEFVLYDIDKRASDLVAAVLKHVQSELGTKAKIVSTDQKARAFKDADYITITISTGGLKAMAHDLAIPEDYGIYHTVGDTSGPGGWARLMRNFGVFQTMAQDINRIAPGAMVLNYTNPMTTLTSVLCELCDGPVVGLCHGLFENLAFLKDFYHLASEDDISVNYAGVNHFFWMTDIRTAKRDLLADLTRRLKTRSFTDLIRQARPDAKGHRELATELFRMTGVMPYLGDRHTCEFFPGYITSKKNMRNYKIVRTSIDERVGWLKTNATSLRRIAKAGLPEGFVKRSRETAADIIAAHVEGRPFIDVGNLPNIGQVANLPLGTIVETAMRVDRNGFSPITFGLLPTVVEGFVEPYTRVFDMGVEACFTGDRATALQALQLDPVCSHLNADEVNEMGGRLLQAHRKYVTQFRA